MVMSTGEARRRHSPPKLSQSPSRIGAPTTAPYRTICYPAWRSPSTKAAAARTLGLTVSVRARAGHERQRGGERKRPDHGIICPQPERHPRVGAKPHSQTTPIRPISDRGRGAASRMQARSAAARHPRNDSSACTVKAESAKTSVGPRQVAANSEKRGNGPTVSRLLKPPSLRPIHERPPTVSTISRIDRRLCSKASSL
jgi:hypothetical protein